MKIIATLTTCTLLAGAAIADNSKTGTIVWDAGMVEDNQGTNVKVIEVSFSPVVQAADGRYEISSAAKTKRHFIRNRKGGTSTFRQLELPTGDYVLSGISYRQVTAFRSGDEYQAFCPFEQTMLFNVPSGETIYVGQLQLNEPTGSPIADETFTPISGMQRSLEESKTSKHWKFGSASLATLEVVALESEVDKCAKTAQFVKGWGDIRIP